MRITEIQIYPEMVEMDLVAPAPFFADPGTGNWLDTKGRTETILLARYLLPENELPPIITNIINV